MKNRSKQNELAVEFLIEKELYAPSIHSAYYSSLQLFIHYIRKFLELSEADIDAEITKFKKDENNKTKGTHVYYIKRVKESIKDYNPTKAADIISEMNYLKKLRVQADYKESMTEPAQLAKEAKEKSTRINCFINTLNP